MTINFQYNVSLNLHFYIDFCLISLPIARCGQVTVITISLGLYLPYLPTLNTSNIGLYFHLLITERFNYNRPLMSFVKLDRAKCIQKRTGRNAIAVIVIPLLMRPVHISLSNETHQTQQPRYHT